MDEVGGHAFARDEGDEVVAVVVEALEEVAGEEVHLLRRVGLEGAVRAPALGVEGLLDRDRAGGVAKANAKGRPQADAAVIGLDRKLEAVRLAWKEKAREVGPEAEVPGAA